MERFSPSVGTISALVAGLVITAGCGSSSSGGGQDSDIVVDDATTPGDGTGTGTNTGTDTGTGADTGTDTGTDTGAGIDTGVGTDSETLAFSSAGAVTGETIYYGFVEVSQPNLDEFGEGEVTASFLKANIPLPAGDLAAAYRPAFDTCVVTNNETDLGDIPDINIGIDYSFEFVSAGENVVFTSPSGTWLTLPRQEAFGFQFYGFLDETEFPFPAPSGLIVDIPGDAFPAFPDVAVPNVDVLTGVDTGTGSIAPDTVFRWDAGSNADLAISIDVFTSTFTGNSLTITSVDCVATDDGEFAFPPAIQAELGSSFSASSASLSRTGINFLRKANSLLIVMNSSSSQ